MWKSKASAKINLCLQLIERRSDGYHTIESLMAFAAIGDEITITKNKDLTLTVTGEYAPQLSATNDNLIIKAAALLQQTAPQQKLGAAITLHKNLPIASGLGGGSSDAASTLKGLNTLWNLKRSQQQLAEYGIALGADLPACLAQKTLWASGIGEQLTAVKINLPPIPMVLVNPNKPLSAQEIYQCGKASFSGAINDKTFPNTYQGLIQFLHTTKNDLEPAAIHVLPEISTIKQALSQQPGCSLARMSGSGATCFGLYDSADQAATATAAIQQQHPNWWVKTTALIL